MHRSLSPARELIFYPSRSSVLFLLFLCLSLLVASPRWPFRSSLARPFSTSLSPSSCTRPSFVHLFCTPRFLVLSLFVHSLFHHFTPWQYSIALTLYSSCLPLFFAASWDRTSQPNNRHRRLKPGNFRSFVSLLRCTRYSLTVPACSRCVPATKYSVIIATKLLNLVVREIHFTSTNREFIES